MNIYTCWFGNSIGLITCLLSLAPLTGCARSTPSPQPGATSNTSATSAKSAEPQYQGQPLSFWIDEMNKGWGKRGQGHEEESMRAVVLPSVLAEFGPEAAPAIPALIDHLSRHPRDCSHALARIGSASVPALTKALQHQDENQRFWAAATLGRIGLPARRAVPSLRRLLSDVDGAVRVAAAQALWQVAASAEGAAAAIDAPALQADFRVLFTHAGLQKYQVSDPLLLQAEPVVQLLAYHALRKMKDEGIRAVVEAAKSADPARRARAATLLDWLRPATPADRPPPATLPKRHPSLLPVATLDNPDPSRLPELIRRLLDEDIEELRWKITGQIAAYGEAGVVQLVGALGHQTVPHPLQAHYPVRIVQALGWLGPRAAGAYPALLVAIGHQNPAVRQEAIWAIHFIEKGREALPLVLTVLEAIDDDRFLALAADYPFLLPHDNQNPEIAHDLKLAVISFCAAQGPDAASALPLLVDRWHYGRGGALDGAEVRTALQDALNKIDPEVAARLITE